MPSSRTRRFAALAFLATVLVVGPGLAPVTPAAPAVDDATSSKHPRPPAHRVDLTAAMTERTACRLSLAQRIGCARNGIVAPPSESRRQTSTGRPRSAPPADDVTGDGLADAVVRDPGPDAGTFRLYAHDGSTSGNPWGSYVSAGGAWDFADVVLLADVTGDGEPDVIARDPAVGDGTLWIYPNNGAATGNPWTDRVSAGTGWNKMSALLVGDVTGDGHPDLLAREAAASNGTLWIYPHDGSSSGDPWTLPRVWAGTGWNLANAMQLDDVNGDDEPDAVVRDGAGSLWVYPHNGSHTGNPYTSRYSAGTGWGFADLLLLADATGDGYPDVLARDSNGQLWIYPHSGATTGNPYTTPRYSAGADWGFANALVVGDVTGDGRPDILARVHAGDVWVYPNDGTSPWRERFAAGAGWGFENELLLGDVTGDGRPDLVARDPSSANGDLWIYPHTGVTDRNPWTATRSWAGSGWNLATAMMLGDLTGDGWADILMRDRKGDLWIYPHSGSGSGGNPWTTAPIWAGTGWNTARALALGDVNGDGTPDLVDLEDDGSLWIYPTGSSGGPIAVTGDWSDTTLVALGDVDGADGLDLVTRESDGDLWIGFHDGSGAGNPWTSRRLAGSDWAFASAVLL